MWESSPHLFTHEHGLPELASVFSRACVHRCPVMCYQDPKARKQLAVAVKTRPKSGDGKARSAIVAANLSPLSREVRFDRVRRLPSLGCPCRRFVMRLSLL